LCELLHCYNLFGILLRVNFHAKHLWHLYESTCVSLKNSVKEWIILLEQRFIARMPSLLVANTFELGTRFRGFLIGDFHTVFIPCCLCATSIDKLTDNEKYLYQ